MSNLTRIICTVACASLLNTTTMLGQELLNVRSACNFDGKNLQKEFYVDAPSKEATRIVEKIMHANVLPQNFILKSADCQNALATVENGQRYILYNTAFLENFKTEAKTQWAAYCVLAHEIGHHLSNHNLMETDLKKRKLFELQADKFAGGVLFRLGATMEQAQSGINTFSQDQGSATHPPKTARLESIAAGWKQAQEATPATSDPSDAFPGSKGYTGSISTDGSAAIKMENREFNQPYRQMFEKSMQSLKNMPKVQITRTDGSSGVLEAEKSATGKSFGEKITIYITELEPGKCRIVAVSDSKVKTTLMDWGANKQNLKTFFEGLNKP